MATQYFAQNRKVGDGVTTVWDFSFAGARPDTGDGTETYLEQPDVLVALTDYDQFGLETRTPVTTGVTFGPGPAQITVVPAIADGQEFVIYRDTLVETPVADFTDFASISEQDLDFSFRQALFVVQELSDTTQSTETFARLALSAAGDAVNTTDSFVARVDSLETDVENLLGTGIGVDDLMYKSDNLSGLTNIAAARANIGVKSIAEAEQYAQDTADAKVAAHVALADPHTQYAVRAQNLSDLTSAPTARNNLGLGTAAVQPDSRYNIRTNNLGDVADKAIARENLSVVQRTSTLGAAVLPAGTTAQRPVGGAGLFRFNAELGVFEGYDGVEWSRVARAQSDGMPLGPGGDPVVESGSNSEGDWVKWADGTGIARRKLDYNTAGVMTFTIPLNFVPGSWTMHFSTGDMSSTGSFSQYVIEGGPNGTAQATGTVKVLVHGQSAVSYVSAAVTLNVTAVGTLV